MKETGKVIGNISCCSRDFEAKEVGYIINADYQKKGYAAEALSAVIRHAFDAGIHRVYAECDPRNERSWRLLSHAHDGHVHRHGGRRNKQGRRDRADRLVRVLPAHRHFVIQTFYRISEEITK